jgi:hypothetical protein
MAAPPRRSTVRSIAASTPAGDSDKTMGAVLFWATR